MGGAEKRVRGGAGREVDERAAQAGRVRAVREGGDFDGRLGIFHFFTLSKKREKKKKTHVACHDQIFFFLN